MTSEDKKTTAYRLFRIFEKAELFWAKSLTAKVFMLPGKTITEAMCIFYDDLPVAVIMEGYDPYGHSETRINFQLKAPPTFVARMIKHVMPPDTYIDVVFTVKDMGGPPDKVQWSDFIFGHNAVRYEAQSDKIQKAIDSGVEDLSDYGNDGKYLN